MRLLAELHSALADHAIDESVQAGDCRIELNIHRSWHPLWHHHGGCPTLGKVVKRSLDSLCTVQAIDLLDMLCWGS